MPDTNNVRIVTPGGEVHYIDNKNSGTNSSTTLTPTDSTTTDDTIKIVSVGDGIPVLKGIIDKNTYGIRSIKSGNNIQLLVNDDNTITISSIAGVNKLSELQDVDIISVPPTNGDVLAYNGSEWVALSPDWSGQNSIQFPIGTIMWIKIIGSLGTTTDYSDSDTLYLKTITSMPSTWKIISVSNTMVSINTGLSSGTAFPIAMQSSVGSVLQMDSTAQMVTSTSYAPNQAMMDFDDNTGILNLYRINSQTIYCSSDETVITLYLGFYIMKDQAKLWS